MSVAKLSTLLVAITVASSAGSVAAQSFPTDLTVFIDGERQTQAGKLFINKEQCERENADDLIRITVPRLGTNRPGAMFLELWVGQDSTDCHNTTGRTWVGATMRTPCYFIESLTNLDTNEEIVEVSANRLFNQETSEGEENPRACDLQNNVSLFLVPLANETNPPVVPSPIGDPIRLQFTVDITPLGAPPDVRSGSGQRQVNVSWGRPSGADNLTDYAVYFDPNSIQPNDSAECTSELLVEGKELTREQRDILDREAVNDGMSKNVNPDSLGLEVGEKIALAVTSIDAAGNESALSEVICLSRVPTSGFLDACEADEDCRGSLDGCSLLPGATTGWLGSFLSVLGLGLWLRRRRAN